MNYEHIIISTGDIKENYEIIDIIYAIESVSGFTQRQLHTNTKEAFSNIKLQLKEQCYQLNGDAIIYCQVRTYTDINSIYNFSAIGTVVKLKTK